MVSGSPYGKEWVWKDFDAVDYLCELHSPRYQTLRSNKYDYVSLENIVRQYSWSELLTVDVEHSHVRFLGNLVLNLWDCGGYAFWSH